MGARVVGQAGPKFSFVAAYAKATGLPWRQVRHRIRFLFLGGFGPRGQDDLTDTVKADWVVGLMASPTHIGAAEIVRRYREFRCIGIGGNPAAAAAITGLLPALTGSLVEFLAATFRGLADGAGFHVLDLAAAQPPWDEFTIRLVRDGDDPVTLTFGVAPMAARIFGGAEFPNRLVETMDGRAVTTLAKLPGSVGQQPEMAPTNDERAAA